MPKDFVACAWYIGVFVMDNNGTDVYLIQVDREVDPAVVGVKRISQSSLEQIDEVQSQTQERNKMKMRTECGLKEDTNPMLSIPADLFQ